MATADFDTVWREMAEQGRCDDIESAEHRRVFWEWMEAGFPADVEAFIADRANFAGERP